MKSPSPKHWASVALATVFITGCRAAPPPAPPAAINSTSSAPTTVAPQSESTTDTNTITGQIYADNTFQLWVNGELIAEDPIPVMPHNVVNVSFPAKYPLTIAIRADDTADPNTGLEYNNTKIGDGGLIARFSNGLATQAEWRCTTVFVGPLDANCVGNANTCKVSRKDIPSDWYASSFDDSAWNETTVYANSVVRPDGDYGQYQWGDAQFIWTGDLQLDNTVLCRIEMTDPNANSSSATSTTQNQSAENNSATFTLTSPAVAEGGALPKAYTCDGASATLPLEWSGAPAGTQSFALIMHHIPGPNDSHWYWVLYDIPADTHSLPQNISGLGILGNNSVNGRTEYAPPCSKGPGAKTYTYTLYALSAPPQLTVPAAQVSRDVLLAAISDRTLASATLNVTYTR